MTYFRVTVPCDQGAYEFVVSTGNSLIIVGANGSGKTRLAVHIEEQGGESCHRISAHRALKLNAAVPKISENEAKKMLRYGIAAPEIKLQHRIGHRWQKSPSTNLLIDFDYVIQALFAEQANTSLDAYKRQKNKEFKADDMKITKFDLLDQIWSRLLPHRQLHISGDDILVSSYDDFTRYNASEMSDGERAIFYLVGQALVAQEHALLIIDEPELHVHPSIMSKLWDEIEAARPDCAFIFITHDLNFAAARSAQKYVIKSYNPKPLWEIQETPNETGFDEETTTLILGSRRPILFAEGERSSLDFAIYRSCFPDWTVIPRGSCGNVIYSVATMRENAELTWVKCSGIVDADDFRGEELERLRALGVEILPVSEIENIFLLPDVCRAIAQEEGFCEDALEKKLKQLYEELFYTLDTEQKIEKVAVRYAKRRLDRLLKRIDVEQSADLESLSKEFESRFKSINISEIAQEAAVALRRAVRERNAEELLFWYDNKGLMELAARHLKSQKKKDFESWVMRVLKNNTAPRVRDAIKRSLPEMHPN